MQEKKIMKQVDAIRDEFHNKSKTVNTTYTCFSLTKLLVCHSDRCELMLKLYWRGYLLEMQISS